jgi:hypothetical protein
MRCQTCASEITEDSRYCSRCGVEVATGSIAPDDRTAHHGGSALVVASAAVPERLSGRALTGLVAEDGQPDRETSGGPTAYSASKRLNAHSVHNLLTQANLYRMRGQFTEAIDCCVAVLRVQSGNTTAHSLLGDIYRDQGKPDDAIQWYRMALDLRPNPSDQAKLTALERQRQQAVASGRGRKGRGVASNADPLAAATGLNTGTTNLMGLSPRLWLRGIWIASLSFLAIVLIALIAMRSPQGHLATAKGKSGITTSGGFGGNSTVLPPLNSQRFSGLSAASSHVGNALSAAQPSGGSQLQHLPANGAANATATGPTLPTAPVTNVRPMATQGDTGLAADRAPRDGSIGETHDMLQPMALTDNLRLGEVRYIGNNTAAVFVNAPQELTADFGDNTREMLIRNVYRAARTVFAQNSAYMHLNVFVQAQVPSAGGDAVLLEAGVDRQAATAAAPDTEPLNSLVTRLQSVKWAGPLSAGNTSVGNISVGNGSADTSGMDGPTLR